MFKQTLMLCCALLLVGTVCKLKAEGYKPWDELTADWWIDFGDGNDPNMYPVNAADDDDIDASYTISFLQASNKAKGMNALKFFQGGLTQGHFVSRDKTGCFVIANTGNSNTFSDIMLLIVIDTNSLPDDFSMTVNLAGRIPYALDANDFVYYDNPYGRPSGFYSATDPNIEPISYAFDTAMVTVYGVSGVTGLESADQKDTYPFDTITIEYSFDQVPAPVVFSVYGYVATDPIPSIYHTNRAFIDSNDPASDVSTFAVTFEGDLNGDLMVDLHDLAIMSGNWLSGTR